MSKEQTPIKDLDYYKSNAEEDYIKTPISVLRYISELESNIQAKVLEALEPIRKEIQEIKNINQSMKIDLKLAKSLLKELKQK
jgi:hypothetical protein